MVNGEKRAKFKSWFQGKHHTSKSPIEDKKTGLGSGHKEEPELDTEGSEMVIVQQDRQINELDMDTNCSGDDSEADFIKGAEELHTQKNLSTDPRRSLKHSSTRHDTDVVKLQDVSTSTKVSKVSSKQNKKTVDPSDHGKTSKGSSKCKCDIADSKKVSQAADGLNPQRKQSKKDKKKCAPVEQKHNSKDKSKQKVRPTGKQDMAEDNVSKRKAVSKHRTHSASSDSLPSNSTENSYEDDEKEVAPCSWDITQSRYYHELAILMENNEQRRAPAIPSLKEQYIATLNDPVHTQQEYESNKDAYYEIYNRYGNHNYEEEETRRTVDFNSDIEVREYHENKPPRSSKTKKYK